MRPALLTLPLLELLVLNFFEFSEKLNWVYVTFYSTLSNLIKEAIWHSAYLSTWKLLWEVFSLGCFDCSRLSVCVSVWKRTCMHVQKCFLLKSNQLCGFSVSLCIHLFFVNLCTWLSGNMQLCRHMCMHLCMWPSVSIIMCSTSKLNSPEAEVNPDWCLRGDKHTVGWESANLSGNTVCVLSVCLPVRVCFTIFVVACYSCGVQRFPVTQVYAWILEYYHFNRHRVRTVWWLHNLDLVYY